MTRRVAKIRPRSRAGLSPGGSSYVLRHLITNAFHSAESRALTGSSPLVGI
jgi:hypothetical protein